MSFSSFLADPAAVRDRGEWLCHFYLIAPDGSTELLRISRRGTATETAAITVGSITIPAHSPYVKRLDVAPTRAQSLWTPSSILSRSIPSYGEAVLNNRDGWFDQYRPIRGYRWDRYEILYGDAYDLDNTLGLISEGSCGAPHFSVGSVRAPLLGRESAFQVPTSTRVYRGTSYMLELSGVRTVSFGSPAAINLTGNMTAERWWWIDTAPNADNLVHGWSATGGGRPWGQVLTTARNVRFICTIGGISQSATTAMALAVQTMYHVAVVVSGRDVIFYIWNDDTQTLTTETFASALTSATRDSFVSGTYQMTSSGTLVLWTDESRVWNVARTLSQVEADRYRPIPAGSIPASLVHYAKMDDGAGTTVTDSSASAVNGTISGVGTSTWLWPMEGGPELAGKPKPDTVGQKFAMAAVLVSPIHQAYQVSGSGSVQSITSQEGGNPHTMSAAAASFRAFLTTAPAAGASLPYLTRGYFRLGSSPVLPISATVQGYNVGGYVSTPGPISRMLVTTRGPKLADPAALDTASFTAYGALATATIGFTLYGPNTEREYIGPVLDMVNVGSMGWWGYVGASALFHIAQFAGPSVTADYDLHYAIIDVEDVYPPPPVVHEVVVRYHKNDVVMTEDQVAATVKGTANWSQWTLPYLEKRATDEELRADYTGESGISMILDTALYNDADAQALAESVLALVKGVREIFIVTLRATGLEIEIGMTVTLTFEFQEEDSQRFHLDGTNKYLVIATDLNRQEGKVRITVWR